MRAFLVFVMLTCLVKPGFAQCSNQISIVGNPTDGKFQQVLLASYIPNAGDYSQSEIVSEAWTCSSLGAPTCQFRSLLRYDLSAIPANATIVSAQLYLTAKTNNVNGNVGNPMFGTANSSYLQKVTTSWVATSTGWNNQPTTTTTSQKTLAQSSSTSQNYTVDITDFVQSWVSSPAANYGMMLRLQNEQYYNSMIFNSGQASASLRPTLVVSYTLPGSNLLTIAGNPTDGLFQQALLASYTANTAETSQTEIVSEAWTCNGLGFPTCQFRSLLKYNLSAIPSTAIISSAKLYLSAKTNNINGNVGNPMFGTANTSLLQKVTAPWALTSTGWANQPTTTSTGEKTLAQSSSTAQDYAIDVTDFVQSWVTNPSGNYGMMLRLQNEQYYNSMIFNSGQAATAQRPTLVVCYTFATAVSSLEASSSQISISPNPANDFVNLSIRSSQSYLATITITDGLGREIYREFRPVKVGNNSISVEGLKNFKQGVYFVTVFGGSGRTFSSKLLIQ